MDKNEVIRRLKEHLKAKEMQRGFLVAKDKFYCQYYIMDFLNLSVREARRFIKDYLPALADLKKWGE
jgi:hypothetical protein